MKEPQKKVMRDCSKRHLFLAKYIGIRLIDKAGKAQVITEVRYDERPKKEKNTWTVEATLSSPHEHDNRTQIILDMNSTRDTIVIDVGVKLGRCIKTYNEFHHQV
mmetsp:Transcript_10367/g.11840  ORF Transcript_10367/g.11840 Transcript_10367/m.11840 type:complete len:105 (-) Transcript_10367:263-577(-)